MTDSAHAQERAQFALIGIGVILGAIILALLVTGEREWWQWLMLGGPVALVLGAFARLRRIRASGRPDRP